VRATNSSSFGSGASSIREKPLQLSENASGDQ
jgi:hypothetical protein